MYASFTVFPRKSVRFKQIYYVRFRDSATGERLSAVSSGQCSKTAAKNWAIEQSENGTIQKKSKVDFTVYTKNWFIWESCPYKGQRFSHSYADACRGYVLKHLQPFFGTMKLQDIGVPAIEDFIVHMQKQQYSSSTINNAFSTLSIILNEAVRQGRLEKNPAKHVKCVAKRSAEKDLIPLNTAHELFDYRNLDLY